MTDSNPLDGPPHDDLDRAFRLPRYIQEDTELNDLFDSMVLRLRREALGIPMNSVQTLLMERIASMYVIIKYREDHDNWAGASQQKDFNDYWLKCTVEFNRILTANDDKLRQAMLLEIQKVVMDSLKTISDPEERRRVMRDLSGSLANAGF
jgi:hypothetical protein